MSKHVGLQQANYQRLQGAPKEDPMAQIARHMRRIERRRAELKAKQEEGKRKQQEGRK